MPSGNMSASLMLALGLSVEGMNTETDWKPPSTFGLTSDGRLRSEVAEDEDEGDEEDDEDD